MKSQSKHNQHLIEAYSLYLAEKLIEHTRGARGYSNDCIEDVVYQRIHNVIAGSQT